MQQTDLLLKRIFLISWKNVIIKYPKCKVHLRESTKNHKESTKCVVRPKLALQTNFNVRDQRTDLLYFSGRTVHNRYNNFTIRARQFKSPYHQHLYLSALIEKITTKGNLLKAINAKVVDQISS